MERSAIALLFGISGCLLQELFRQRHKFVVREVAPLAAAGMTWLLEPMNVVAEFPNLLRGHLVLPGDGAEEPGHPSSSIILAATPANRQAARLLHRVPHTAVLVLFAAAARTRVVAADTVGAIANGLGL